jgi:hypothetical protein
MTNLFNTNGRRIRMNLTAANLGAALTVLSLVAMVLGGPAAGTWD